MYKRLRFWSVSRRSTFCSWKAKKSIGVLGAHDVGGDQSSFSGFFWEKHRKEGLDSPIQHWEKEIHSTLGILCRKGLMNVDELRRGIEQLPSPSYDDWTYYEKWAASILRIALERGTLQEEQVEELFNPQHHHSQEAIFQLGQQVRVRQENMASRWEKPHLRTPGYIFGEVGVVNKQLGMFPNPELNAFRRGDETTMQNCYKVRFQQSQIWPEYKGGKHDSVDVDIFHDWLESAERATPPSRDKNVVFKSNYAHDHHHEDCSHSDHSHGTRDEIEQNALDLEGKERPGQRLVKLIIPLLIKNGIFSESELRSAIEGFDTMGSSNEGARLVVRAWMDSAFKDRLLKDGNTAASELKIQAANSHASTKLIVVENTSKIHNIVVCTLCSCYPLSILGPSPSWYKSRSYRARAVREPRKVLSEFGTNIPEDVSVIVHDSTADIRYMVLPMRPQGTENLSEEELINLVTRDSMIGVSVL